MANVGMAVIGWGTWGANHCRTNVQHPHADLIAVCDADDDKARQAGETFGADYYTDYQEMLKDDRIGAVAVVTPDFAHTDPAVAAAEAGKHILCEKPLATTRPDPTGVPV